jgi:predicted RNase H-like HicB family nuclease
LTYDVLIHNKPADGYIATALSLPGCSFEAPTREEVVEGIRRMITQFLTNSEIIQVEVALPQPMIAAPYMETFGMFRDDPTFPEFIKETRKYRRKRNRLTSTTKQT